MLLETPEIALSENPDRIIMVVPGLRPKRAREVANRAVAEARRKMPKMSGNAARRLQPLYGKDFFGIFFPDCVAVGTKVLTADWRWVPAEELTVGESLIAFDDEPVALGEKEKGRRRHYRTAIVEATGIDGRECVEIEYDDGTRVVSTKTHPWLTQRYDGHPVGWIRAEELRPGDRMGVYLETWKQEASFDSGWLSGIFDGEGSYVHSQPHKTTVNQSFSAHLQVSQNDGVVLDRIIEILHSLGFQTRAASRKRPNGKVLYDVVVKGGFSEQTRLLGSLRPIRLMSKIRYEGRMMKAIRQRTVVAIRDVGVRDVVVMQTSTGTYLAEGMGSHNTYTYYQEKGIRAFTMTSLAGKTIPMWVSDSDGKLRAKNPKIKTRVTEDGRFQVLIFRRAAPIGQRKPKYVRSRVTGEMVYVGDTVASYPGAPGRINRREPRPTNEGVSPGWVAKTNVGVRWRHPGLEPKLFLNNSMTLAAQWSGIMPIRLYLADRNWKGEIR